MKTYQKFFCLSLLTLNACGTPSEEVSKEKYVLGHDDRVSVDMAQTPWKAVGRLSMKHADNTTSFCTGTLIGKNIVITAAHCIHKAGVLVPQIEFMTQYSYGTYAGKAKVIKSVAGSTAPQSSWAKDWALLKLDKDLGSTYGYLGVWGAAATAFAYPFTVDLPGYSSDVVSGDSMSGHLGCSLLSVIKTPSAMAGTIDHNCDLQTGASGAPLIGYYNQQPYVAAIQSYHYAPTGGNKGNGAVATDAAYKALATF